MWQQYLNQQAKTTTGGDTTLPAPVVRSVWRSGDQQTYSCQLTRQPLSERQGAVEEIGCKRTTSCCSHKNPSMHTPCTLQSKVNMQHTSCDEQGEIDTSTSSVTGIDYTVIKEHDCTHYTSQMHDSSSWGEPDQAANACFTSLSRHIAGVVTVYCLSQISKCISS